MTRSRRPLLSLALALLLLAVFEPPALAQGRQRLVKRPDPSAATVSGQIVAAGTGAPVSEALVRIGPRAVMTGPEGTFSISGLNAQTYELEVSHWLYVTQARQITLSAGHNRLDITLQPAAAASVTMKNGSTYSLAAPTVQFGYVVAFVGWRAAPELRLCLPSGEQVALQASDMKTVTIVGTRTESTECCSLSPGTVVRIARRSGEVVEGTIFESCSGSKFFVLGRNRNNGNFENLELLDAASITFE